LDNSQIAQRKPLGISFIEWSLTPPPFLSRLESIWILHSDLVVETIENGISLFQDPLSLLYFESLGLDITSVILNRFKMAATYPFCDFFLSKNHRTIDSRVLHFWSKEFYQFQQIFLFGFETCSNWILSISISKIYLRSYSNLLIHTNPRSLPLRNESILSTRAPSCTIYITTQQKNGGFSGTGQRMSSQEHFHSYTI